MHAYMVWSQKFRKSEISLDTGNKSEIKETFILVPLLALKSESFLKIVFVINFVLVS